MNSGRVGGWVRVPRLHGKEATGRQTPQWQGPAGRPKRLHPLAFRLCSPNLRPPEPKAPTLSAVPPHPREGGVMCREAREGKGFSRQ